MTDHADFRQQLAAHALGALEEREAAALEAHLDGCAKCRRELREHREVLVNLATAAPAPAPRPELRGKVLDAARRARAPRVVGVDEASDTAVATSTPDPKASKPPASDKVHHLPTPPPSSLSSAGWLAAAAMAVLAVLAGWGYLQADRARAAAADRADRLVVELEQERTRAAVAEDLIETMLSPDVATASLSSTEQAPSIRLFWNRGRNVVVVAAFDLPAPPEGRTYQLWGIDTAAGTDPVGLGTFEPVDGDRTVATFELPAGVSFDLAAVTEEPDGGSPAPTTTPFLAGPVPAGS